MSVPAARLRTLRRVYGTRGDARSVGDIAFLFYAAVLVALIVVFPMIRVCVILLTQPGVVANLQSPSASAAAGAVGAVLLAGMAWLGRLRGPVTLQPFFVTLLASTDMPRSVALRRHFATSAFLLTAVITGIGVVFAGVLLAADAASLPSVVTFLLASAGLGLLGAVGWTVGQHATLRRLWVAATTLLVGAVLVWVYPVVAPALPWGWFGLLWPRTEPPDLWPLLGLVLAAIVALCGVPRLLNSLDSSRLLDDAERWQTASTAAVSGDVAHAMGLFRARPTVGRAWNAVAARTIPLQFLRRDVVATLRTPGRFITATFCVSAAWVMVVYSLTADSSTGWLSAAIGAAIGYFAVGVFSDGFRHAAQAASAPPIFGHSVVRLYLLHALFPLVMTSVSAVVGATIAIGAGVPFGAAPGAALLVPLLVVARAYDSAKGDLPVTLLTPVLTPAGDVSGLSVLAWQADALLTATIAWAVITSMVSNGQVVPAVLAFLATIVGLVFLLRRRLLVL